MTKTAKTIWILVIAVLVVSGYVYLKNNKVTQEIDPNATVDNEIKDWKTYTNEKYGYSIQYPTDWIVDTEKMNMLQDEDYLPHAVLISDKNEEHLISVVIDEREDLKNSDAPEKYAVLINGQTYTMYKFPNGYECMGDGPRDCSYLRIPIKRNGLWYNLGALKNIKSFENTYIKIFSTFKFTK